MKALTLWGPWHWAISHGPKRVENRDWPPPRDLIGQWFAIHGWRMHIGNLVPPDAAEAIGRVVVHALLVAASGAWVLSSEDIWVLPEQRVST